MAYKDKEKQREYQRNWLQRRRQAWIETQGPTCNNCGSTEGPWEVDHINPETKVSHNVWSWKESRRVEELSKCQLLCNTCHWEKSASARERNHGLTLYGYGCRCEICYNAQSVSNKRRYLK